jgi:hypothetical protein
MVGLKMLSTAFYGAWGKVMHSDEYSVQRCAVILPN